VATPITIISMNPTSSRWTCAGMKRRGGYAFDPLAETRQLVEPPVAGTSPEAAALEAEIVVDMPPEPRRAPRP
jgi:hypothetical protein